MLLRSLASLLPVVTLSVASCSAEPEPAQTGASSESALGAREACPSLLENASSALPVGDVAWRASLLEFAQAEVKHPAWGLAHAKRNFLLSMQIARAEKLAVDEDVLFAAAFLHDLGGLTGHDQEGVDHAVRSAELAGDILLPRGFPEEKLAKVKEVILAHTYYNPVPPSSPEATVFRDADVLDFLGAIGFARIASVTGRDTPDLAASVRLSRSLNAQLPSKLLTPVAKCNGEKRAAFLASILDTVQAESFGGAHQ